MASPQVVLIDAKNAVYRFGWAHKNLKTKTGIKTGVSYGVLTGILRLKHRFPDAKPVLVWDGDYADRSWRKNIFPQYKGNRNNGGEMSPDTREILGQIPGLVQLCSKIGVIQTKVDEVEADDLIGVLAMSCVKSGWDTLVYSSDQDFMQLTQYGVRVVVGKDLVVETDKTVKMKYKCSAEDLIRLRAMIGDQSDNIPGLRGIGPVRAAQIIADKTKLPELERSIVSRNCKLMRILTETDKTLHQDVPQIQLNAIAAGVKTTMKQLVSEPMRSRSEYELLLEMLGELDMRELLEKRRELWELPLSKNRT